MNRIFTLLLTLLTALAATAATKIKYPGGRQYMYRLTLADKKESGYRLEAPTHWLSAKAVERRKRQGLKLDSTDLPVSPGYLKTIRAHHGVSI